MISVALACYNGERYIERQLNSILNQNLAVDEVIICDDKSADNTVAICKDFIKRNKLSNWNVYINEANVGYCLNFYSAISKCNGDIIFIADQDDEWLPNKTEAMCETLKHYPKIMVLASRYDVIDEYSRKIENSGVTYLGKRFDGSIEYVDLNSLIGCSYIRGFSLCFRRQLKTYLKPIDLKSLLSHDWLICSLGCVTGKTAILNTLLTHYRYHKDNVSLSAMNKENRKRELKKRILGLNESVSGHRYILSFTKPPISEKIEKFIAFEQRRARFLQNKNLLLYVKLFFNLGHYNRYYKGKGLRVYIGDFYYAFKKH